ncbi:hypothetical protein J2S19_001333 [Metabacillus malikii]|uniref:Uncharacterized protein n=1 Tax=Metabacillus malikii TaxID=1504265 RepID=A0ABT9ZCT6_9BACI|nr:hypothetical protein [Metabacillus malikii]
MKQLITLLPSKSVASSWAFPFVVFEVLCISDK